MTYKRVTTSLLVDEEGHGALKCWCNQVRVPFDIVVQMSVILGKSRRVSTSGSAFTFTPVYMPVFKPLCIFVFHVCLQLIICRPHSTVTAGRPILLGRSDERYASHLPQHASCSASTMHCFQRLPGNARFMPALDTLAAGSHPEYGCCAQLLESGSDSLSSRSHPDRGFAA